ncbi:DUF4365 domain-containing protein [Bradyrhizobium sp. LLZ17]|uniref:DUF4365 domain-containing protein n=1 Tax=Bradyrhizobium sp. LLZ17 TaxID=3239388 RepID=A0AB39XH56_9BRAD
MKQTDREGVLAVGQIFTKQLGWLFREQSISDWGIDAHAEVADEEKPTGRLLALQIKSGKSYFKHKKKDHYVYYGEGKHLWYWQNNSLPVALVLYNPETDVTLWARIGPSNVKRHKTGRWSIKVPKGNVLNRAAKADLVRGVSDASVERKVLLALDYPLIRALQSKEAYFLIDRDTQNEDIPWTVSVFFDDIKADANVVFLLPTVATDISEFFQDKWPWLDYRFLEGHEILPGTQGVLRSRLHVWVNDLGKAYLEVEKYYESGASELLVDDPGLEGDYDEDDEEESFRRSMEKD